MPLRVFRLLEGFFSSLVFCRSCASGKGSEHGRHGVYWKVLLPCVQPPGEEIPFERAWKMPSAPAHKRKQRERGRKNKEGMQEEEEEEEKEGENMKKVKRK